jgi:hypothetical protein
MGAVEELANQIEIFEEDLKEDYEETLEEIKEDPNASNISSLFNVSPSPTLFSLLIQSHLSILFRFVELQTKKRTLAS